MHVSVRMVRRGGRGISDAQIILQLQDEKIARLESQIGRLVAVPIDVTVAS
jgi:hypothetical protein